MNICVFCSMYDVAEVYKTAAADLGARIGKNGYALVWGGGSMGLMGLIANSVQENGGTLIGITTEKLLNQAREQIDEFIVVRNLAERKRLMCERADAFLLLPGGIGSLDEITDMLELKKHKIHTKPVVVLNTNDFYDGFYTQLQRMESEGFAISLKDMVVFVDSPEEAMLKITKR